MKWNDFRKAECGAEAKATPAKAIETTKITTTAKTKKTSTAKPMKATNAQFLSKISYNYSKETPGKARLHTCVDQYNANKAQNANGGMKWIEEGGGYWSECNKRLKSRPKDLVHGGTGARHDRAPVLYHFAGEPVRGAGRLGWPAAAEPRR